MNCIEIDKIQAYIDGECTAEEAALIEKHISTCAKCAAELEHQRQVAAGIKKALGLLVNEADEIPAFIAPATQARKGFTGTRKVVYSMVAACALLLLFLFFYNMEEKRDEQVTVFMSLGPEVDANRPFAEQEMQINIIDSKGNISEFPLK